MSAGPIGQEQPVETSENRGHRIRAYPVMKQIFKQYRLR